jgi:hypothetical protein
MDLGLASFTGATADELSDRQGDHAGQGRQDANDHQQLDEGKACLSIPKRITHCSH